VLELHDAMGNGIDGELVISLSGIEEQRGALPGREELGEVAVGALLLEIGFVGAQAQAWAIERQSHFDLVDPPPNCDAVHCVLILRRLAGDLRELARRVGLRVVNDNGSSGGRES
jgi:hypothetical protein